MEYIYAGVVLAVIMVIGKLWKRVASMEQDKVARVVDFIEENMMADFADLKASALEKASDGQFTKQDMQDLQAEFMKKCDELKIRIPKALIPVLAKYALQSWIGKKEE